jgi:hypothetical protein
MNEALGPQMAKTRHNISSIMVFISSFSAHPAYSASKRAAQISMKAAAARYEPQGVWVNIDRRKSWCGLVERHRPVTSAYFEDSRRIFFAMASNSTG